jgi:molybdopterin synthase catalytic subunit
VDSFVSSAPLDLARLLDETADERAGGLVIFGGMVRDENLGAEVLRMRYEVHGPLASRAIETIEEEVLARFDVLRCRIQHREGFVELGEPSVWIVVRAKHRADAFEASRYAIDELKKRVPIWKEEFYADGTSRFLDGHPLVEEDPT